MRLSTVLALAGLLGACNNDFDPKGEDPGAQGGGDDTGEPLDVDTGEPPEPDPDTVDDDGDGFTEEDGDCDDADADINPAAEEICDGVDNDCDGTSDADADVDGDGLQDCADACPVYVDVDAAPGGTGHHDAPLQLIQDGIEATVDLGCNEVEVAAGLYIEQLDTLGYPVHVYGRDGAAATVVDAAGAGSVLTIATGEDRSTVIEGLTLTGGVAAQGGGAYLDSSSPHLLDLIIDANEADGGAGVRTFYGDPLIEGCSFTGNDACWGGPEEGCDGGGIMVRSGAPEIIGNVFELNRAGDGGALWLAYADALVAQNVIARNEAHDDDPTQAGQGGGIDVQVGTSDTFILNNIIVDNTASSHGGGVVAYEPVARYGEPTIAHNVVAWNRVTDTNNGAGILANGNTAPVIKANVVYGNDGPGITTNAGAVVSYNLVWINDDNWSGAQGDLSGIDGNLQTAPLVVRSNDNTDWTDDDWTPVSGSPLIDGGDPAETDADGTRADIGAYGGAWGGW